MFVDRHGRPGQSYVRTASASYPSVHFDLVFFAFFDVLHLVSKPLDSL